MSGWNNPDKLAEARAAHAAFHGRSPDSRGHGTRGGRAGAGAGAGRGRGSASPSPARSFDNNMITAGRGRGGHPTPTSSGLGGFGGNNTARVGGSDGRNGSAGPLATSDEFYAFVNNNKKTKTSTGGSAVVSSAHGISAAPGAQKTVAQNTNNISGGGPMELDKLAQSSKTATNPPSPGRSVKPSRWGNLSGVSEATQGNDDTDNSGGPMDLDSSKNAQSKTGNHGLCASRWAESPPPPSASPSELAPIYRSEDWIKDLEKDNEADTKRRAALASAATPGYAYGDARGSNTEPAMRTPAASSVGALAQTRTNNCPAQGGASVTASFGVPNQANNIRAQPAARPAPASGVFMQGQAHSQRTSAIQSGTQPVGQRPVGAAQPAAGPAQAYQPPAARPSTQVQPQQAQGAAASPVIGAHASPNSQPLQRGVSGATSSFAGFGTGPTGTTPSFARYGAGPTAQSIQQLNQPMGSNVGQQRPQAAGGDTGQQSAQSAQSSQDPFDDVTFRDFWEKHYMPNNR